MLLRKPLITFTLLIGLFASGGLSLIREGVYAAVVDPHAYFTSLIARRDHWKSFSLRPQAGAPIESPYYGNQLLRRGLGGYAASNNIILGTWITYDYAGDTDRRKQDAAKVVIPALSPDGVTGVGTLTSNITATTNPIRITDGGGPLYNARRAIKLDNEILTIVDPDGREGPLRDFDSTTGLAYVQRGTYGTTAAAHSAGAVARVSINTVPNAVRLPLGTSDGHSYLFTWDAYWTDSYLQSGLTNHKAFNFITDRIWLEPQANYGGGTGAGRIATFNKETDVAAFQVRLYNNLNGPVVWALDKQTYAGPQVTGNEPLSPQLATFTIKPNRWIRFWVLIDQRLNDYDNVDVWIADEVTDPIQTHRQLPVSASKGKINEFVLEFNTSTDLYVRGDTRNLIAYVRNFVALQDVRNPISLLERPIAGAVSEARTPAPPRNVRIVPR